MASHSESSFFIHNNESHFDLANSLYFPLSKYDNQAAKNVLAMTLIPYNYMFR